MLIHDNQYLETLRNLLNEADEVSMAVAFWGAGSTSIFEGHDGKPLRIICNLALGGTNPAVICELQDRENTKVRQLDNLHAKLVLTKKAMIVGSANISSNGLGLEAGETAGFRELGMLSEDEDQLKAARAWFDEIWEKQARKIDKSDLDAARKAWKKRRGYRPPEKILGSRNLLDQPSAVLKDSEIYFVIYRNDLSLEAAEVLEKKRKKDDKLDAYEEVKGFPRDRNAVIIPIRWGEKGGITIYGAQAVKASPLTKDGGGRSGSGLDFTIMGSEFRPDPFSFTASHRRELKKNIGPWLESICDEFLDEDYAGCVPVYKFLESREELQRNKGARA